MIIAALLGAGFGLGVWLVIDGLRPQPVVPSLLAAISPAATDVARRRLLPALAIAAPVGILTRWPVAAAGLGLVGWFGSELFGSKAARERDTARTEAIATWTEMLRDTMSGAHGLEEAVMTTAGVAPAPIRAEVGALAARVERESLTTALQRFADELAHPTGDLVVTALVLASRGASGDLADLLSTLAVAARDEAAMRLRVEAARARLRTAVKVIAGCTAATAAGLILLNRSYLDVYATAMGQLVLLGVAAAWGTALWWLSRMSRFVTAERFLARAPEAVKDMP